jgi:hypothetical protein
MMNLDRNLSALGHALLGAAYLAGVFVAFDGKTALSGPQEEPTQSADNL